ncbi:MAG: hypothetical protein RBS56_04625 [Candidatus Gracilibacteria bacterium]|jgi:hypothetical protein|nr:hypothetical protein [Candidatus Gracilibacteria bacterium]
MKINDLPILGRINHTFNRVLANLLILAFVFLALAVSILIYPPALTIMAALLLMVACFSLINIAYNVYVYKKRYLKLFKFLE